MPNKETARNWPHLLRHYAKPASQPASTQVNDGQCEEPGAAVGVPGGNRWKNSKPHRWWWMACSYHGPGAETIVVAMDAETGRVFLGSTPMPLSPEAPHLLRACGTAASPSWATRCSMGHHRRAPGRARFETGHPHLDVTVANTEAGYFADARAPWWSRTKSHCRYGRR